MSRAYYQIHKEAGNRKVRVDSGDLQESISQGTALGVQVGAIFGGGAVVSGVIGGIAGAIGDAFRGDPEVRIIDLVRLSVASTFTGAMPSAVEVDARGVTFINRQLSTEQLAPFMKELNQSLVDGIRLTDIPKFIGAIGAGSRIVNIEHPDYYSVLAWHVINTGQSAGETNGVQEVRNQPAGAAIGLAVLAAGLLGS